MGFCLFNNIVVATRHLQRTTSYKRIAIVDYDVHHGNGTQEAFYADSSVLFISVHQESNYPHDSGPYTDIGAGGSDAEGTTINIPLPPGSGHGAYMAALHTIILPALDAFAPDFLLVSSGFDASFQDPLASMMLSSVTFGAYARALQTAANRLCHGRLVCAHEGVSGVYPYIHVHPCLLLTCPPLDSTW
jgi:acetoin utilization deacetylase AcuC-like enzyme